jgi:hypothetical protein
MPIDFGCTSCGQRYRVKDEFSGKSTKCRKFSGEVQAAMKSLRNVSDQEIDQRFALAMATVEALIEQPVQPQPQAEAAPQRQPRVEPAFQPRPQAPQDAAPAPSLVGLFFRTMFGPMDAVFILLAFFTAYRVGSGSMIS